MTVIRKIRCIVTHHDASIGFSLSKTIYSSLDKEPTTTRSTVGEGGRTKRRAKALAD